MRFFGYDFRNEKLLEEALTTPSFRAERMDVRDNQRLEFLGDAVLNLLSANEIFSKFPGDSEGDLTVRRSLVVSSSALCEAADRLHLAAHLKFRENVELPPRSAKVYADAIEALLGAAWLDGGFDAAMAVYEYLGLDIARKINTWEVNPRGALQTLAQKNGCVPQYTKLNVRGTSNNPTFEVKVSVDGLGEATASAHSLKEAEANAAARLLSMV